MLTGGQSEPRRGVDGGPCGEPQEATRQKRGRAGGGQEGDPAAELVQGHW